MALPTYTQVFDDIVSSTLPLTLNDTYEQSFLSHPIVEMMTANKKTSGMGESIQAIVKGFTNSSVRNVSSSTGNFTYTPSSVVTKTKIDPVIMIGYTIISAEEESKNSGDEALASLIDLKAEQLAQEFVRHLALDFYSNGIRDGVRSIAGLKYWVPATVGGTVANIDDTTNKWWQSRSRTGCGSWATNGWLGSATTNYPLQMWVACSDGAMKPGRVVSDFGTWMAATTAYGTNVRYVSNDTFGKIGYSGDATFFGVPWTLDKDCPSGTMYMLHPQDFQFFSATSGQGPAGIFDYRPLFTLQSNPLLKVQFVWSRHQLVCTRRNDNGQLSGWTVPA